MKKICLIAIMVVFTLFFSACGNTDNSASDDPNVSKATVEDTVTIEDADDQSVRDVEITNSETDSPEESREDPDDNMTESASEESPDDTESIPEKPEENTLLESAIMQNNTITLNAASMATFDTEFYKDFTIDCAGHSLTLCGRVSLMPHSKNRMLTITNATTVDLSELEFYRDPDQHIDEADFIMTIKGEDTEIIYPADLPAGSHKDKTKGFFYEDKGNGKVFIRYGGR